MENRFQEMDGYFARRQSNGRAPRARAANAPAIAQSAAWVSPMSADQRALVILIENGGIDLQIPRFVDAVIDAIPGSSLLPDSVRRAIRDFVAAKVNEPIRKASKDLLESAELLGNRYLASKPNLYGDVVILQNGTASYEALKKQLIEQSRAGKIIDLFILTHGTNDCIAVDGCINGDRIRKIRAEYGKPLSIRSVYMMSCVGSTLSQPWRDIGAQVVSGTRGNNYLPEPTMFFFWSNWKAGNGFETAVTRAYEQTVALLNEGLNNLFGSLVLPRIDVRNLPAIKESEPVVSGQGSIVIGTDELDFSKSLAAATNGAEPKSGCPSSVSPQGLDLIQRFEAFVAKPTADASGHCSVGYGTLLHEGACDGRASEQPYANGIATDEARKLLACDLAQVVATIVQTAARPLTQNQLDALSSLVYSIGAPRFQRSRLARQLADGNFGLIADEIRKWTRARVGTEVVALPGLVRRRSAEADLWQSMATGQSLDYAQGKDSGPPVAKMNDEQLHKYVEEALDGVHAIGSVAEIIEIFHASESWAAIDAAIESGVMLEGGAAVGGLGGGLALLSEIAVPLGYVATIAITVLELHKAFATGRRLMRKKGFCYSVLWAALGVADKPVKIEAWGGDTADELRAAWEDGLQEGRDKFKKDIKLHNQILLRLAYEKMTQKRHGWTDPEERVLNMLWHALGGNEALDNKTNISWIEPLHEYQPKLDNDLIPVKRAP